MVVEFVNLANYEELKSKLEEYQKENEERIVYIYFSGEKNDKGISWCSDCAEAEPIVMKGIEKWADGNAIVLLVNVGDRETWKNSNNPFRKDDEFHLLTIPTLVRWHGIERLEEAHVKQADLLQMFFEEAKSS